MKTFSIKRTAQLMQYYWRTEKKLLAVMFFTMMACFLGIIVMNATAHHLMLPSSLLYWILVTASLNNFLYLVYVKKETAIVFFTLPATNLEKFLSRVLYASFGSIVMATVAEILSELLAAGFAIGMDYLTGNPYNPQILRYFVGHGDWTFISRIMGKSAPLAALTVVFYFALLVLPVFSVFTLCSQLFHRWSYIVGALLIVLFGLSQIIYGGLLHGPGVHDYWKYLFIFFAIVTVVCYVLAYWSFCRQEMRKKWIHI